MRICIPVTENRGLESLVSMHFGSAPFFALTDTETGAVDGLVNQNEHHAHGMCRPLDALAGHAIDALVVGGIGMGALMKLQAAGIKVFRAPEGTPSHVTVAAVLTAFKAGRLIEVDPSGACAHHGHGH
jgi:predicted Fe-Mo cluster-binding NifX family protein